MGVVSEKVVRARKTYSCDECRKLILPGDQYRRLYGNAEDPDPKYVLRIHVRCPTPPEDGQ